MEEFSGTLRMPSICRRWVYIKKHIAVRNMYSKYKSGVSRVFHMSGAAARTGDIQKK